MNAYCDGIWNSKDDGQLRNISHIFVDLTLLKHLNAAFNLNCVTLGVVVMVRVHCRCTLKLP